MSCEKRDQNAENSPGPSELGLGYTAIGGPADFGVRGVLDEAGRDPQRLGNDHHEAPLTEAEWSEYRNRLYDQMASAYAEGGMEKVGQLPGFLGNGSQYVVFRASEDHVVKIQHPEDYYEFGVYKDMTPEYVLEMHKLRVEALRSARGHAGLEQLVHHIPETKTHPAAVVCEYAGTTLTEESVRSLSKHEYMQILQADMKRLAVGLAFDGSPSNMTINEGRVVTLLDFHPSTISDMSYEPTKHGFCMIRMFFPQSRRTGWNLELDFTPGMRAAHEAFVELHPGTGDALSAEWQRRGYRLPEDL